MSVWGDIRRRAEGTVVRKENLPPVDSDAEKKKQDAIKVQKIIQEQKRKMEREHELVTSIICVILSLNMIMAFIALLGFEFIMPAILFGIFMFLASRFLVFFLGEEWDRDDW